MKSFDTLDPENLMYLCATYAHIDEFKTSIDCYDSHISRFENSENTEDIFLTVYVLMSRAYMSFQLGDYESSIKFVDKDKEGRGRSMHRKIVTIIRGCV